ncbi:unnamed protein product [Urochloa humidicola]
MDERACAAALVLAFAGEASLRTGSMELVRQAGVVEDAADAVGASSYDLAAAARDLSRADDTSRLQRVAALEQAANAVAQAAAARQGVLRRGAESLARACGARHPQATHVLLGLADELWFAAAGVGVPRDDLERAGRALLRARADAERADAVLGLDREAAALAHAAVVRLTVLGCGARMLAMACQNFRRVADAIPVVRRAAEAARAEQGDGRRAAGAQQEDARSGGDGRPTGAWWPWLRRSKAAAAGDGDLEAPLLDKADSSTPTAAGSSGPSKTQVGRAEKTSGTQGYALYGSLSVLPNLEPDGLLKAFSSDHTWWFNLVLLSWWSSVALGVQCSLFPHSRFDVVCAHLTSRLAILGINLLVILYGCLMLAPGATAVLGFLLTLTLLAHVVLAGWHYYNARGHR